MILVFCASRMRDKSSQHFRRWTKLHVNHLCQNFQKRWTTPFGIPVRRLNSSITHRCRTYQLHFPPKTLKLRTPKSEIRIGRELATRKDGCTEVRVYTAECGEQLGRDLSKNGSSKSLIFEEFFFFWGGNTLGLVPASLPHTLGYACTFYTPTTPPPRSEGRGCLEEICLDFEAFSQTFFEL